MQLCPDRNRNKARALESDWFEIQSSYSYSDRKLSIVFETGVQREDHLAPSLVMAARYFKAIPEWEC